ncbi:trichohyalin-like [Phalaenopsis equestris]|uniref:trichohyalin-like n=1 Tax=Phalaenopsis equestris TaxID=78828 RepID=UPI0009E58D47|nr:trichohyalin-like [Phalaenopsis equestris]XP_020577595.1 trichohyalin-like [Phalaenopsis equestris]
MEKWQSSRPWSKKINGSSVMARSDYNDVFGLRPWHATPFSRRLDDYSEIFDVADAASTIPVLDLSVVENDFEKTGGDSAGVDYLDIFGSIGGGGSVASYDELIAEAKISGDCSSEGRTRRHILCEKQGKETSEYPLKTYTANDKPNLKMNPFLSFPRLSDDSSSDKSSMLQHRMSRKKFDDVISDKTHNGKLDSIPGCSSVDASDPVQESKNKAEEFECASLREAPRNEKDNSQFYSSHQTSSGHILLNDVPHLKVSEIGLQTKPFKGPPPSRPPPPLSMKPEHPKVSGTDSSVDFDEQHSLKSKVHSLLHSSNEATIDESMKGCSFLLDAEMDPNSAAAVSIAAIKEAMEQAQILLTNAKKMMDRKRDKSHCKIGPPKTMCNKDDGTASEVTVKDCSNVIDASNLLKESNMISECTFVEREEIRTGVKIILNDEDRKMLPSSYRNEQKQVSKENASKSFVERGEIGTTGKVPLSIEDRKMQLSPYKKDQQQVRKEKGSESSEVTFKIVDIAEEWKTDKEYYELLKNDRFLNIFSDICSYVDEKKEKTAICYCEDRDKYSKDSEHAIEVEEKQKSMEGSVCIEKLERNIKLKGPCLDWKEKANENLADSTMDEILLKGHTCELEEYYGSFLSDENRMQSEAHADNNNEDNVKKLGSVVDYRLHEENIKKLQNFNFDFKPWVANGYSEEKELQCAERVSGFVEYRRKFNGIQVKYGVNESDKEVKVQNETFFQDIFENKIKEPDELCTFNTTDKEEVDEEIKPRNSYENETGHLKHQYYDNADRRKIEGSDDAAEKEVDEFETKEKAHMLVKNELERGAIQDGHGLVLSEEQEKIKNTEFEKILNSREEISCKDCSEEETKEAQTTLQKDEESMGALMNNGVNKSEFLASAEGVSGQRVSENITEVPMLLETQISANSADEAHQLGEIDESDTRKVFLSGNERILLPDATEISHVEKAVNHKHSLCIDVEENKSNMDVVKEKGREPEAHLEDKALDREKERERIAAERVNYETHQQVLAEARVRAERIAVERATAEARQRALAEARQKAEKAAEAEKAFREARLRAERVAVERATEEARKRAIEKALAEKAAADARQRTAQLSASNKDMLRKDNKTEHFKATHMKDDSEAKHKPSFAKIQRNTQSQSAASSANDHIYSDSRNNGGAESKLKFKERQERQQQTVERAAKAFAERNMRDIVAQREQAERVERDRLAESLDGEVKRWSSGKDGNLRALLSTLQYILGPDSGWQPIPLTDIKNATAAKKAYRRATLCVHPDKLQQRGASIQQKYICEKVFDLLQEAWNKFNLEER